MATDRTTLKGYFSTNKIPTQDNFADLIDASLNQQNDGIRKLPAAPVSIQADGASNGLQELISFYGNFSNAVPTWSFDQNPRVNPKQANSARQGFNIKDGGGTSRLFIDKTTGNIGLGTINPAGKLDINLADDEQTTKLLVLGKGDADLFVVDNQGHIGIGTATPTAILDIRSRAGNNPDILHIVDGGGQCLKIGMTTNIGHTIDAASGNHLAFLVSGSEKIRFASNGNVGIGTATPGFPLTFADTPGDKISLWGQSGNHYGFGMASNLLQIHTDIARTDIAFGYGCSENFTETMRIKGNGNVGIGTASPTHQLDVAGTIRVTENCIINNKNITPQSDAGWFRIAQGGANKAGIFEIRWATSGHHGHIRFSIGLNYGDSKGAQITVLESSSYNGNTIEKIRLLIKGTYDSHYIEFYFNGILYENNPVPFQVYHYSGYGWSLVDPIAGSLPDGYKAYELRTDILFGTRSGVDESSLFLVDHLGNVGIGTPNPGVKLEVAGTIRASENCIIDKKTTPPLSKAGWFSIAAGVESGDGIFEIRWSGVDHQGHIRFSVGAHFGDPNGIQITVLATSSHHTKIIEKIRLLTALPNHIYIQAYFNGDLYQKTPISFDVYHNSGYGWSLMNPLPVGASLPSGYLGYEFRTDILFGTRSGVGDSSLFLVDHLGNVGIGTATPGFPLSFPNTFGDKISIWGQSGPHYGIGQQNCLLQIHTDIARSDVAFGYGDSEHFTETMRIKGTGNVGIGTATPARKLHVQGQIGLRGDVSINSTDGIYWHSDNLYRLARTTGAWSSPNYQQLEMNFDTGIIIDGGSQYGKSGTILQPNGGNVGIGTTTPGFPLTFTDTLGDKISLWGQNGIHYGLGMQSYLLQIYTSVVGADIAFGYGDSEHFTETMRIKGNGNVGIGTTDPGRKLHVKGTTTVAGTSVIRDGNDRPTIQLEGNYPHFIVKSQGNAAHAGTIGIWSFNGEETTHQWNMGVGQSGLFSMGYAQNEANPHAGTGDCTTKSVLSMTSVGNVGIGTLDPGVNRLKVARDLGGDDPSALQHDFQLEVRKASDNKSLGIGVLDNGIGVIQAKEVNVGYQDLLLNPVAGSVGIGTTTPKYTLDVNGGIRAKKLLFADGSSQSTATVVDMGSVSGPQLNGVAHNDTRVMFKKVFKKKPNVIVNLSRIDCAHDRNLRINASVIEIQRTYFVVRVESWADTIIYSSIVSWVAASL